MRQISSLLQGLARSLSVGRDKKGDCGAGDGDGKTAMPAVLRTSGTLWGEGSETFAAVCSRRGEKGINQDCSIVWEVSYTSLSLSFFLSATRLLLYALLLASFNFVHLFSIGIFGGIIKLSLHVIFPWNFTESGKFSSGSCVLLRNHEQTASVC